MPRQMPRLGCRRPRRWPKQTMRSFASKARRRPELWSKSPFRRTVRAGRNRRTALSSGEWSGIGAQRVVIDWMTVGDAASAKDFGDRLLESPRSFADRTSISGAIEFAMTQLARAPFAARRRTID